MRPLRVHPDGARRRIPLRAELTLDRLFLRVFATLLVGLGGAALIAALVVLPQVRDRVKLNIAETLSPPVAYLAEALAEAWRQSGDLGPVLDRARQRFTTPVAVVARQSLHLQPADAARLERGEVVQMHDFLESIVVARIDGTDQVVQVGPINAIHPLGEGRGAAFLILLVGGLLAGVLLLVEPIRRRLGALARTTEAFGCGDLSARAPPAGRDAIGALSRSFNAMAGQIERLVAAHQALLRMVSHELRTPLQRLHFKVERIRDGSGETREQALDHMANDLDELDELLDELLTYVRLKDQGPIRREAVAVAPLLRELCESLSPLGAGIALGAAPESEALVVSGEARLLKRALSNLIVNALRYARTRVELRAASEDGGVCIEVHDDGPGIPVADRERVFEPFQRLDDDGGYSGRGFGLGLAIVRRVAEAHGGTIVALDSDLGGVRLRLTLPVR